MKIAISTSDGKTICGHLSKCSQFIVYEASGFEIMNKRLIRTAGACVNHDVGSFHDCQAVITQGMGQGMYDGLVNAGVIPVLTSETDPEVAVLQFLSGGMTGSYQGNSSCGGH
jgi:predicted Fe-Mo cluster-binding NifX family protein